MKHARYLNSKDFKKELGANKLEQIYLFMGEEAGEKDAGDQDRAEDGVGEQVLVSSDELITFQELEEPEIHEEPLSLVIDEIVERQEISTQLEDFLEEQEQIFGEQHEEAMKETGTPELPAFPGLPQ